MQSVNLIAPRTLRLQSRQARLNFWIGLNAVILAGGMGIAAQKWMALSGEARVDEAARLQLEFESAELTRQTQALELDRVRWIELARRLLTLDDAHAVAPHLARVLEETPAQVTLSNVILQRREAARFLPPADPSAGPGDAAAAAGAAPAAGPAPAGGVGGVAEAPPVPEALVFEVRGYALDHNALRGMIQAIESEGSPLKSELRETSRSRVLDGDVVSFIYDLAVPGVRPEDRP